MNTQEPLIFRNMSEIRDRLAEISKQGGLDEVRTYVSKEFKARRAIELGGETSYIFDVQLRRLDSGDSGDVVLEFANNPTPENSTPLVVVNVVDSDPKLQLTIRKQL